MTAWAYDLDDGTTGTVEADDYGAVGTAVHTLAAGRTVTKGRTVMLVCRVERPDPPIVHSPNGTAFTITVDDEGVVTAARVEGERRLPATSTKGSR